MRHERFDYLMKINIRSYLHEIALHYERGFSAVRPSFQSMHELISQFWKILVLSEILPLLIEAKFLSNITRLFFLGMLGD